MTAFAAPVPGFESTFALLARDRPAMAEALRGRCASTPAGPPRPPSFGPVEVALFAALGFALASLVLRVASFAP